MPPRCAPGKHVFKFGKCASCGKPEGKLMEGGSVVDPGGVACPKSIGGRGKHRYKFGTCTLCKASEHGGSKSATPKTRIAKASGPCPPHLYKFGKCAKCGKQEGKLLEQGSVVDPGGVACPKSIGGKGKHRFKFGSCQLCHVSEHGGSKAASPKTRIAKDTGPCPPHLYKFGKCSKCGKQEGKLLEQGSVVDPGGVACPKSIGGKGKHRYKFGSCSLCKASEHGGAKAATPKTRIAKDSGPCPPHLYKFGKCSKCGKQEGKLLEQGSVVDPGGVACPKSIGGKGKHRFKFGTCTLCKASEHGGAKSAAPKTRIAKESGDCPPHLWKFGKCARCGKQEGKLADAGSFADPGSVDTCPKSLGGKGKHKYQFSKCKLCNKREF